LVAFVGLDVRVRQGGKWLGRQFLSKRGNGYLRKVLFQIGWSLYMNNDTYHAAYQRMRERGKNHKDLPHRNRTEVSPIFVCILLEEDGHDRIRATAGADSGSHRF
jgi:transposase